MKNYPTESRRNTILVKYGCYVSNLTTSAVGSLVFLIHLRFAKGEEVQKASLLPSCINDKDE